MQTSVVAQESLEVQHAQRKTQGETQESERQEDAGALDSTAPSKKRGRVAKAKAKGAPGESAARLSTSGADAAPEQLPMGEVVPTAKASKKRVAEMGGEVGSPRSSKRPLPASQESDEGHRESARDEEVPTAPAAYSLLNKKIVKQAIKEIDPDIKISPSSLHMLAQTLKESLDADVEHALTEDKKLLVATDALRR